MKHKVVLVLMLAGLAGCASYESKPIDAADSAVQLEARNLDDPGLLDFVDRNLQRANPAPPSPRWGLDELTLAAFYYHPDLDVARARWKLASAQQATAGQRVNPSLGAAPAYNTTTDIPSPWIVGTTIDIPVSTAGKRRAGIAEAAQLSEAARFNIATVAWQLRSRVRNSLLDVYAARELLGLRQNRQGLEEENFRMLERQYAAGAISTFELTQARLQLDSARLAMLDAERADAEAQVLLAQAIGVPVAALEGLALSFEGLGAMPADLADGELRRRALSNRADVLGALAEYAASQAALQREVAKQYPDIVLGPGYEYDQGDDKWSLGVTLELPLLTRNRGGIAEAEARREEAAARFVAVQAGALSDIDSAFAGYRVALRADEATDSMLTDMTEQETRSQAMFTAGELSRSELVAAQIQLSEAAIARIEASVAAQRAAGLLEDALQLPLDAPDAAWQNDPKDSVTVHSVPQQ